MTVLWEEDGCVSSEKRVATPPGYTIREQLEYKAMSVEEFACQMRLTSHEANDLLTGVMEVTQSIASRLERVVGVSATFWKNLDALYREKLNTIESESGV